MKILLADLNEELVEQWLKLSGEPVEIVHGSILQADVDAVVSPANSFGFMDGGIDATYRVEFGDQIELAVRRKIWDEHQGELLIGAAAVVETGHAGIPYLVAAPTMRVPMRLPPETVNPYLATRAALRTAIAHGSINSIAIPGMASGIGGVSPQVCASQMMTAINHVLCPPDRMPMSWAEASEDHQRLYGAEPRNLQHG
jgi:O-acetyl-ADP-ribose deacetylase (regulator of RNase III)